MKKEKVGVYVRFTPDTHEKLWDYIKAKYPKSTYGALSLEVEEAVKDMLSISKHTQTQTSVVLSPLETCGFIVDVLRANGIEKEVSLAMLKGVIHKVRGTDPRTVKKWIGLLCDHNYLKRKTYNIFEVLTKPST